MPTFRELYESDLARYGKAGTNAYTRRLLRYLRKIQTARNPMVKMFYRVLYKRHCEKRGNEIPWLMSIGKGFYVGHPFHISINPSVVIGENCNIHKGVVLGQTNRGSRKGAPVIGNRVWIGMNAIVVGQITVGDDVLIAPGSYVNRDVPPHTLVFGNPAVMKPMENATEKYIENTV